MFLEDGCFYLIGPQRGRRRAAGAKRPGTNDSSLYEDVNDEDQYCAIDYDQIKNYEYGYAQYGPAQYGPAYMGPQTSSGLDAQQLVMLQQQQIYRQQQSRTSTLGSMRGGDGGGMYHRIPNSPSGGGAYQAPVATSQKDAAMTSNDAIQMDNMKQNVAGGSMANGGANGFPPTRSPPSMQRGPTRAPPPPPNGLASGPPNNDDDYMEPVLSSSTSKV